MLGKNSAYFVLAVAPFAALALMANLGSAAAVTGAGDSAGKAAAPSAASNPTPTQFSFEGELSQGGWLRGKVTAGAAEVLLDGNPLELSPEGTFFAGFDRDAGEWAKLTARLDNGLSVTREIPIAKRAWKIERVKTAKRPGGKTNAQHAKIRSAELAQINAARAVNAKSDGWRQKFLWPTRGRISGLFGSQRIYNGEAGSYHTGIDIAGGNGSAFTSPADGVVILAAEKPFSLEGYLLMIDHGNGLTSAFLHCSRIAVKKGDVVTRGQYIGNIGASGRASGPHLHWGLKWRNARLDPLLFTGPMLPY